MTDLPALELLESTHHFPGPYTFKAIGKNERGFVARTIAAAREAMAAAVDPPFSVRETAGGRHVAVTLNVPIDRPEQVLAVYRRMQKLAGLVLLW